MTHHQRDTHHEEAAPRAHSSGAAGSTPDKKRTRTTAVGSPADCLMRELLHVFQDIAAKEHGRAVRAGKTRANARRFASPHSATARSEKAIPAHEQ